MDFHSLLYSISTVLISISGQVRSREFFLIDLQPNIVLHFSFFQSLDNHVKGVKLIPMELIHSFCLLIYIYSSFDLLICRYWFIYVQIINLLVRKWSGVMSQDAFIYFLNISLYQRSFLFHQEFLCCFRSREETLFKTFKTRRYWEETNSYDTGKTTVFLMNCCPHLFI